MLFLYHLLGLLHSLVQRGERPKADHPCDDFQQLMFDDFQQLMFKSFKKGNLGPLFASWPKGLKVSEIAVLQITQNGCSNGPCMGAAIRETTKTDMGKVTHSNFEALIKPQTSPVPSKRAITPTEQETNKSMAFVGFIPP